MRPNQRPRTGKRRDAGIRVIRTEAVRYPGHEHPLIDDMADDVWNESGPRPDTSAPNGDPSISGGRRIQVRDTGLEVVGRAARAEQARNRARRRNVLIGIGVVSTLLLAVIGWRYASDQRAATLPLNVSPSSEGILSDGSAHATQANAGAFTSTAKPEGPTPIFASYGKIKLRLPVPVNKLTEIGFHQASYPWALRMKTPLKDADTSKANKKRGTSRDTSSQPTGEDAVLVGKVLRMWRARPGKPDTAADIGGKPGTVVLSPVTGTVVKIKSYKLYGKWPDYEMHIVPDGASNLDIVMIHLTELEVKVGDRVTAGETKVAHIRKLSDKFTDQLAQYVKGGGDHVHLQVNNAEYKGYKGLNGAVEPEEPTGAPVVDN